jgi:hypothetical protein
MRILALGLLLSCGLGSACGSGGEDGRACRDVTEQIDAALKDNINTGILLPTAAACPLTRDSFDPRVTPSDVDYLFDAFTKACAKQAEDCGNMVPPPPPTAPTSASAKGPVAVD